MAVYLDHNATTQPHEDVLEAMLSAARGAWANPSSLHQAGRDARRLVDDAREAVAALAGASDRDVIFTSGGTEANNLGLLRPFAPLAPRGLLLTSRLEHPSVLAVADSLASRGVRVVFLEVARDGRLRPSALEPALRDRDRGEPCLVAVHAVHHETGALQPVQALLAAAAAQGAEVHLDAVQAAGRIEPALWRGAHSVAIAAHKLRGPKGIGALVTRPGVLVRPLLLGGSQERGLRPGTVDSAAAAGFGVAARRALGGPARYESLRPLRDLAEQRMLAAGREQGVLVESTVDEPRSPHTLHLLVGGWRGDELVAALDLEGICVSSGSACAAGTAEPSPAISAMVGVERAMSALRVSLGETSTLADIDALGSAFRRVVGRRQ